MITLHFYIYIHMGVKKTVENKFNLSWMWGDSRIFENSIFPAYVPEKNKIITPWISFILLRLGCLIKNRPNNVLRQLKQIKNSVDLLPFLLF